MTNSSNNNINEGEDYGKEYGGMPGDRPVSSDFCPLTKENCNIKCKWAGWELIDHRAEVSCMMINSLANISNVNSHALDLMMSTYEPRPTTNN